MTLLKSIDNHPLSSTQKEIWFDQIRHSELPLYNLGGYLQIDGAIEPAIFEKAVNQVIKDNDALRLRIHEGVLTEHLRQKKSDPSILRRTKK
ncbi:MAG: condensation domain-containing protein [Pseudomonadota bacterium]